MLPRSCLATALLNLKNYEGGTAQQIFESINGRRPISSVFNPNLAVAPSETDTWRAMAKSGRLLDTSGLSQRRKIDLLNELIVEERRRLNSEPPHSSEDPLGNLRLFESQRRRLIWDLARPIRLTLPIQKDIHCKLLPAFTDEALRAIEVQSTDWTKTYIVNLLDYTCSSQDCMKLHSGVPPLDVGRICKHIIIALRDKNLVGQLPPIARGIVENGYPEAFGIYPGRFAKDLVGNPIYITGQNAKGWLNVFALRLRNGVNYYRYGYNVIERRWWCNEERGMLYWHLPKIDESVLF
jgi:hypothetical protein